MMNLPDSAPPSTFTAVDLLNRLAAYSRETLRLSEAGLSASLHAFNDRQKLGLPAALIDEVAWTYARATAAA